MRYFLGGLAAVLVALYVLYEASPAALVILGTLTGAFFVREITAELVSVYFWD
ncbi:hypothetical protein RBE51_20165 [Pseudomonas taiwanensis]|uniref:hypothetical protein n=1 Tax=Pseudomonas taiwanensis TaxID=470150 RepID=UPI0028DEB7A8|nr:hypothetical protein [Pseudomonas taiwanensis]MDT8925109.1 hypothetical protein [Pseudomonas taiwanensis]